MYNDLNCFTAYFKVPTESGYYYVWINQKHTPTHSKRFGNEQENEKNIFKTFENEQEMKKV